MTLSVPRTNFPLKNAIPSSSDYLGPFTLLWIAFWLLLCVFFIYFDITSVSFFPGLLSSWFLCNWFVYALFWIQGLRWYAKRLRIDEDGDVADEFLDEVLPQTTASEEEEHRTFPKFQVRYSTRPAKVKSQVMNPDGKIQQCVEYQGRLQWVWRTRAYRFSHFIAKVCELNSLSPFDHERGILPHIVTSCCIHVYTIESASSIAFLGFCDCTDHHP